MSKPLTRQTTDNSDGKEFAFSFFCDNCGKGWKSQPESYTGGGFTAITHDEVQKLIWDREHQAAFERANLDARMHFNQCPLCRKWVCNDCFNMEEKENGGTCYDCSQKNEK